MRVTELPDGPLRSRVRKALGRAPGNVSAEGLRRLAEYQGDLCFVPWCDRLGTDLDHRQPVALGGRSDLGNLQWLCEGHNARKRSRDWREFLIGEAWFEGEEWALPQVRGG